MDERNDGGPAFPLNIETGDGSFRQYFGLSLRDYFAAKALQSVYAAHIALDGGESQEAIVEEAYEIADAMLAERAKRSAK